LFTGKPGFEPVSFFFVDDSFFQPTKITLFVPLFSQGFQMRGKNGCDSCQGRYMRKFYSGGFDCLKNHRWTWPIQNPVGLNGKCLPDAGGMEVGDENISRQRGMHQNH
jgi:hypothetical protein